ncbi:hypothetical protein ACLO87_06865 [Paenalcaligenes sp. Me52]|uniref:hypothetical protein n=1 Tax=Paenalcaligenes sp. Me52 TaxID=3392038 RepID=UPI003D2BAF3D
MRKLMIGVCVVALSGCAMFQNVKIDQLRTPENLRKSGTIEKSIPQIQQALYDYGDKCSTTGTPLAVNPSDPRKARFTTYIPGFTRDSAVLLVELNQVGDELTEYQGYTYYLTWKNRLDQILYIMGGGLDCDK